MPEDNQAIKVKSNTILQGEWLFMRQIASLFIIFMMLFTISPSFMKIPTARADNGVGWDAINTIYYNPAQEDVDNPFLETAASELETYLEKMSGRSWTVVTSTPTPPSINLTVNPAMLANHGDEAFRLVIDSNGITITGKTAIAVRWGAYYLLDEKLGVRWFFKNSAWTVVPDSLASLESTDIIVEPDFAWRQYGGLSPQDTYIPGGSTAFKNWITHNRGYGAETYSTSHSYGEILNHAVGWYSMTDEQKTAYYNAHPSYFLQNGRGISYWQFDGSNAGVRAMAVDYARYYLANIVGKSYQFNDDLWAAVVPISPNDGGMDGFYPLTDVQDITDNIFGLVNYVANNISGDYPGKYVGVLAYEGSSAVPSFSLKPNVFVVITRGFNCSNLTDTQRVDEFLGKGVKVGVYDYLDLWYPEEDAPTSQMMGVGWDCLNFVKWCYNKGIVSVVGEGTDSWGGSGGLMYYLLTKLYWDSSLSISDLLDDFYTKAFGAASTVMQHWYEQRNTDNDSLGKMYRDLQSAETLAAGDNAILARIRQLEYYTRYVWKWHNIGIDNLSNSDLQDFYTFNCKIRDTYMVAYYYVEDALREELYSRGYSKSQVDALQDFNAPSVGETEDWLNEGVTEFASDGWGLDWVNPRTISLQALGDNVTASVTPLFGNNRDILIPSNGNETITIRIKTVEYEGTRMSIYKCMTRATCSSGLTPMMASRIGFP